MSGLQPEARNLWDVEPILKGSCTSCGRTMVSAWQWRVSKPPVRYRWRERGLIGLKARGLCVSCWQRAWRTGSLADYERASLGVDELLAEWRLFADPHLSTRRNCEIVGDRLKRPPTTIERQIYRAKKRGLL